MDGLLVVQGIRLLCIVGWSSDCGRSSGGRISSGSWVCVVLARVVWLLVLGNGLSVLRYGWSLHAVWRHGSSSAGHGVRTKATRGAADRVVSG